MGVGEKGMKHWKWEPAVDLYRTPEGWAVKIDVAGVRPEDVEVELMGKELHIAGKRRDSGPGKGWRHYSMEIQYSPFERVIRLPGEWGGMMFRREFEDGMLFLYFRQQGGNHE